MSNFSLIYNVNKVFNDELLEKVWPQIESLMNFGIFINTVLFLILVFKMFAGITKSKFLIFTCLYNAILLFISPNFEQWKKFNESPKTYKLRFDKNLFLTQFTYLINVLL